MKRLFTGGMLCLMFGSTLGQQAPKYTQYMFNPMAVNAAYAGSRDALSFHLVHRSQWLGFDGAPTTQNLSIHTPLKNQNMAVGFQLVNDRIGPRNAFQAQATYAYRLRLGAGKLALALRGGIYNYNFNWSKIEYHNPADNVKPSDGQPVNVTVGTADFAMFYNTKKTYIGLEAANLNTPTLLPGAIAGVDSLGVVDGGSNPGNVLNVQAHLIAGHAFRISDDVILRPSAVARFTDVVPGVFDLNVSALFKEKLWVGMSLRSWYGVAAIVEMNINDKLRAGLSYDYALNKLRGNQGGSVEVFIGYDLNIFKSKMISPRFF